MHHFHELQSVGPKFVKVLQSLIQESSSTDHNVTDSHPLSPRVAKTARKDKRHG
jgi:hypothetical protein